MIEPVHRGSSSILLVTFFLDILYVFINLGAYYRDTRVGPKYLGSHAFSVASVLLVQEGKCQNRRGYLGRLSGGEPLYILQTHNFVTFQPAVLWTTEVHWRREEAKMKTVAVRQFSKKDP